MVASTKLPTSCESSISALVQQELQNLFLTRLKTFAQDIKYSQREAHNFLGRRVTIFLRRNCDLTSGQSPRRLEWFSQCGSWRWCRQCRCWSATTSPPSFSEYAENTKYATTRKKCFFAKGHLALQNICTSHWASNAYVVVWLRSDLVEVLKMLLDRPGHQWKLVNQ